METSDQQIFDAVAQALDYKEKPLYATVRPGEIQRICLDSAKAQRELGWSPRLPLQEGIRQTTPYYVSQEVQP